jgi:hypothetical protein
MDKETSTRLRWTFLSHAIVSVILGAGLWVVPGRTLMLLGWVQENVVLPESDLAVPGGTFVDPLVTRLLGAALLALAFAGFQGWRAKQWSQVSLLVQMEAVFCAVSTVAFIATLFLGERGTPPAFWVLLIFTVAFGVAWGFSLLKAE